MIPDNIEDRIHGWMRIPARGVGLHIGGFNRPAGSEITADGANIVDIRAIERVLGPVSTARRSFHRHERSQCAPWTAALDAAHSPVGAGRKIFRGFQACDSDGM